MLVLSRIVYGGFSLYQVQEINKLTVVMKSKDIESAYMIRQNGIRQDNMGPNVVLAHVPPSTATGSSH